VHHWEALREVIQASRRGEGGVPPAAVAANAFAAHFLTDAFSAGHLVNKDDVMRIAAEAWEQTPEAWFGPDRMDFVSAVARRVLAVPRVQDRLVAGYRWKTTGGKIEPASFALFLRAFARFKPDKFRNSFVRLVHDQLNAAATAPGQGIEVENDRGVRWFLSGDATLENSPDTLRIARAAVEQSYRNLERVAAALAENPAHHPHRGDLFAEVWSYVPRPAASAKGRGMVDWVISRFTDPRQPDTIAAFAELLIEEMDLVIDELLQQGYIVRVAAREGEPARR
jgi:hypothetical protein